MTIKIIQQKYLNFMKNISQETHKIGAYITFMRCSFYITSTHMHAYTSAHLSLLVYCFVY